MSGRNTHAAKARRRVARRDNAMRSDVVIAHQVVTGMIALLVPRRELVKVEFRPRNRAERRHGVRA